MPQERQASRAAIATGVGRGRGSEVLQQRGTQMVAEDVDLHTCSRPQRGASSNVSSISGTVAFQSLGQVQQPERLSADRSAAAIENARQHSGRGRRIR